MRQLTRRGMTLVELMVSIAILAILVGMAAPFFGDYIANSRLREAGNVVYASALFARNEAIKRNGPVSLSVQGSTVRIVDDASMPAAILREQSLPANVGVAEPAVVQFGGRGRPVPFGNAYTVALAMPGVTCSESLRCPALQVDAGGDVHLCRDAADCR